MSATSRRSVLAAMGGVAAASILPARAQAFPSKRVTLLVPFPPGGPVDLTARQIGQKISEYWNQAVIIENRPGADAVIGAQAVQRADPDGHTLLVCAIHHTVHPSLKASLPYDFLTEFVPVSGAGIFPIIVCAHPSLPVSTVGELAAYAKANPGKLHYGSGGAGTTLHLAAAMLAARAGLDMVHVPYRGGAPAATDLVSGKIPQPRWRRI